MATEDDFNIKVGRAVVENVKKVFGSNTSDIINYYLKQFDTDLDHISTNPDKVSEVLHMMFGPAAYVVEKEIARAAYDAFGITPDSNYGNLETTMKKLRETIENLQ